MELRKEDENSLEIKLENCKYVTMQSYRIILFYIYIY